MTSKENKTTMKSICVTCNAASSCLHMLDIKGRNSALNNEQQTVRDYNFSLFLGCTASATLANIAGTVASHPFDTIKVSHLKTLIT